MSARCPEGHLSQDPDYCDQCGLRITSGQDSYGYRSEDRGASVGSYGGGSGRGGSGGGAGGYDPLGIPRDSNPARPDGSRAGDPYSGDQYGYGAAGGGGYDDRGSRQSSYAADGYDQGTYSRGGGRDDRGGFEGRDAAAGGGYGARGGREEQDHGRGGREAADDAYGRPARDDGYGRDDAYGRGGRDAGRDPQQYADGYGRGDRDAGYGGGREAAGREPVGREPAGRGGRESYPESAREGYDAGRSGYEADPLGGGDRGAPRAGGDRAGSRYPQCPNCRAYYEPGARFCENCGLDFTTGHLPGGAGAPAPAGGRRQTNPPVDAGYGEPHITRNATGWNGAAAAGPATTTTWEAVVEAEREYYDSGDDHRVPFPSFYPRRVFPLSGPRLLVGRRSESRGIHPEIDLSGAPEDPGISRAHAIFERQPDGSYALLDPGSTNGTRLNDEPEPIEPHGPVPLQDGDRVYLGAWTRITIRAR